MAVNIWFHFFNETQALTEFGLPDIHSTPKTLAIVDTEAFSVFHQAWEALSTELLALLEAQNDQEFYSALSRARAETLAFTTIDGEKSAVDVGLFLQNLALICSIDPDQPLFQLLNETMVTYDSQFVIRGTGNGTAPATGMHVFWPTKSQYKKIEAWYEQQLFWTPYYNDDAPMWTKFLATYVNSTTPAETEGASVCLTSLTSSLEPTYEGQLLLNPSLIWIRHCIV